MRRLSTQTIQVGVRWALAGVGAAAMVWGTFAEGPDTVPPTEVRLALLGIGAVLVYLAYSGQLLTALKAGGVEATLAQVVNAVERAAPEPLKGEVGRIVTLGQASPETKRTANVLTSQHKRAKEFEAGVGDALDAKKLERKWSSVVRELSGNPFDFTVKAGTGRQQVRVECRWGEDPDQYLYDLWIAMAEYAAGNRLGDGVVLVVNRIPSLVKVPRAGVLEISNPKDAGQRDALAAAIDNAMR